MAAAASTTSSTRDHPLTTCPTWREDEKGSLTGENDGCRTVITPRVGDTCSPAISQVVLGQAEVAVASSAAMHLG